MVSDRKVRRSILSPLHRYLLTPGTRCVCWGPGGMTEWEISQVGNQINCIIRSITLYLREMRLANYILVYDCFVLAPNRKATNLFVPFFMLLNGDNFMADIAVY